MNFFRNRLYMLGALLLIGCIVILIWYALFYVQKPKNSAPSTFVWNMTEEIRTEQSDNTEERMVEA